MSKTPSHDKSGSQPTAAVAERRTPVQRVRVNMWTAIAFGIGVLGIAATAVVWFVLWQGEPKIEIGNDGAPMVRIPAGPFLMESTQEHIEEAVKECVENEPIHHLSWSKRDEAMKASAEAKTDLVLAARAYGRAIRDQDGGGRG